ncbi:2546_t:CDS:1, partial [Diversispora eburnea]
MDGWTNSNSSSIWNYVITTSNNCEYLYKLDDLSVNSHMRSYLTSKIKEIIEKIGPRRIVAIVSDS